MRFKYEVQPGDSDTDGILIGALDVQGLGVGKIKALNHDVDAIHTYGEVQTEFKVDGRPGVKDVEIISTPAGGDSIYGRGEHIQIAVVFDSDVEKDGELQMELVFGGGANQFRYVPYAFGDGTDTLVFQYEVDINDYDEDGLTILSDDSDLFVGGRKITARGTDLEPYPNHFGLSDVKGHAVNGSS